MTHRPLRSPRSSCSSPRSTRRPTVADVVARVPAERARPPRAVRRDRRRLHRRHRRPWPQRAGAEVVVARRPTGASGPPCATGLAEAVGRGRGGRRLLRRRRRVRTRGARRRWSRRSSPARPTTWSAPASPAGTANMRPHRRVGNRRADRRARPPLLGRAPITDGQSGYRALSADAARRRRGRSTTTTTPRSSRSTSWPRASATPRCPSPTGSAPTGRSFVRLGPYLRKVIPAVWRVQRRHRSAPVDTTGSLLGRVNT